MVKKITAPRFSRQVKHKDNSYVIAAAIVFAAVLMIAVFYPVFNPTGMASLSPVTGTTYSTTYFNADKQVINTRSTTLSKGEQIIIPEAPEGTEYTQIKITNRYNSLLSPSIFSIVSKKSTGDLIITSLPYTSFTLIRYDVYGNVIGADTLVTNNVGIAFTFIEGDVYQIVASQVVGTGIVLNVQPSASADEGSAADIGGVH